MQAAFVFPGQGSQTIGMGKALAETFAAARRVFDRVDSALGQNLSRLMFEGPEDELTLTANAQPALMAVSLAVTKVLETEAGLDLGRDARFVAGHSLGEYSALAAAGSFTIEDAARLLRIRGDAMQKAVPLGEGAMAAIIGLEFADVSAVAAQAASDLYLLGSICQAANDNGGGQVVISGTKPAVERAMELAKAKGAKRAILLPVSAPFHSDLMKPAADAMAAALAEVTILAPKAPLVANVLATAITDPETVKDALVAQVTGAVRWRESVLYMSGQGVTEFFELGAGKVLSGLIRRIADGIATASIGAPADVEAFKSARAAEPKSL
jgi:[acyl-carrier-protein] S-malonyltransferase